MALSRSPKNPGLIVLSLEYTHLKAIMITQYQRCILNDFVQFLIYAINYHIVKENARANRKTTQTTQVAQNKDTINHREKDRS